MDEALARLEGVLRGPRRLQPAALRALRAGVEVEVHEEWNTAFGPRSLYATWSATALMRGLYLANRAELAGLGTRPGWRVVEIGGGDGALWDEPPAGPGEVVCVDPVPEVQARVAARLARAPGVGHVPVVGRIEEVAIPDADVVVASLVLHHVAGAEAAERAEHGLAGPGKLEILARIAAALRARRGVLLVNEADVHCDLEIGSGDPLLEERLVDTYIRRCALALRDELAVEPDPDRRARLRAMIWTWCVDQLRLAQVPAADRDVYELDVPRWLALFRRAGLEVVRRGFTDDYGLFHQYVLRPRI